MLSNSPKKELKNLILKMLKKIDSDIQSNSTALKEVLNQNHFLEYNNNINYPKIYKEARFLPFNIDKTNIYGINIIVKLELWLKTPTFLIAPKKMSYKKEFGLQITRDEALSEDIKYEDIIRKSYRR